MRKWECVQWKYAKMTKKRGRPPKNPDRVQRTIMLPDQEWERLQEMAENLGLQSRSDLVELFAQGRIPGGFDSQLLGESSAN